MKKLLLQVCIACLSLSAMAQQNKEGSDHYLLVGTYTKGKSEGLYVYKFNSVTGTFSPAGMVVTDNPSYLAVSKDNQFVYASGNIEGKEEGQVSAFVFDKPTQSLRRINAQSSAGNNPCYISIDKTGKWIVAANYSSGNFSVLPINKDGALGEAVTTIQHQGSSINKERQEKAHAHYATFSPDNKYLLVVDLGIDKIMVYNFNALTGKVTPARYPFATTIPGAGPRHLDFHPNGKYVYLIEELMGNVVVFEFGKNGKLTERQRVNSLPEAFKGVIGSADIHVSYDGKFLYATNRGESNSITVFSIDKATGKLTTVQYQSTLGIKPRNFNFDPSGNFLLVANQDSGDVVVFAIDKQTGKLTATGSSIQVDSPVCIKWIR